MFVVSNPVDILTYVAADRLDLPNHQVIGLGTQLDTIRFRSLIAQQLNVPNTDVSTDFRHGEHGADLFALLSAGCHLKSIRLDPNLSMNYSRGVVVVPRLFARRRGWFCGRDRDSGCHRIDCLR